MREMHEISTGPEWAIVTSLCMHETWIPRTLLCQEHYKYEHHFLEVERWQSEAMRPKLTPITEFYTARGILAAFRYLCSRLKLQVGLVIVFC
jgi:hypothetical protein